MAAPLTGWHEREGNVLDLAQNIVKGLFISREAGFEHCPINSRTKTASFRTWFLLAGRAGACPACGGPGWKRPIPMSRPRQAGPRCRCGVAFPMDWPGAIRTDKRSCSGWKWRGTQFQAGYGETISQTTTTGVNPAYNQNIMVVFCLMGRPWVVKEFAWNLSGPYYFRRNNFAIIGHGRLPFWPDHRCGSGWDWHDPGGADNCKSLAGDAEFENAGRAGS